MKRTNNVRFPHTERLKSRKLIGRLFREGKSLSAFPLRFVWLEVDGQAADPPVRVGVSVPRRRFRRAVDRNRIKRQMREAYRLQKPDWWDRLPAGRHYVLMLIFIGPQKMDSRPLAKALQRGFNKWCKRLESKTTG